MTRPSPCTKTGGGAQRAPFSSLVGERRANDAPAEPLLRKCEGRFPRVFASLTSSARAEPPRSLAGPGAASSVVVRVDKKARRRRTHIMVRGRSAAAPNPTLQNVKWRFLSDAALGPTVRPQAYPDDSKKRISHLERRRLNA